MKQSKKVHKTGSNTAATVFKTFSEKIYLSEKQQSAKRISLLASRGPLARVQITMHKARGVIDQKILL